MTILVVGIVTLALLVAVAAVIAGFLQFIEVPLSQSSEETIKTQKIQPKAKETAVPKTD